METRFGTGQAKIYVYEQAFSLCTLQISRYRSSEIQKYKT